MVEVNAEYGLCNRLSAISSAFEIAKRRKDRLRVYWVNGLDMNEAYTDAFLVPDCFDIEESLPDDWGKRGSFWDLNPWRGDMGRVQQVVSDYVQKEPTGDLSFNAHCTIGNVEGDYTWLRPIAVVRQEVDAVREKLGGGYVGVHIRGTDNEVSRVNSPYWLFVQEIGRAIKNDPDVRIFLATDDERVRHRLRRKFGNRIVVRDRVAGRFDRGGLRDAAIDLLLLSSADRIIGSFGSTFSTVASRIGKCPIVVVKAAGVDRLVAKMINFGYKMKRRVVKLFRR